MQGKAGAGAAGRVSYRYVSLNQEPLDEEVDSMTTRIGYALLLGCLALVCACGDAGPTRPQDPGWYSLGLEQVWVERLELDQPYLYACAGRDGLFRRRADGSQAAWKYLGFADTTENVSYRGALDILLLDGGDILAGIHPGVPLSPGILRSCDGGLSWVRSDSGMAEYGEYASVGETLGKSTCHDGVVLAAYHAMFRSNDGGVSWGLVAGHPSAGGAIGGGSKGNIRWHQADCSIVWSCSEGDPWVPSVSTSEDHGKTWENIVLRDVVPLVNQVYSIGLDPVDTDIAYLGMAGLVIKTTDRGQSWISPLFTPSEGRPFLALETDRKTQDHVFFAGGEFLYETWDGGETVETLQTPNEQHITDMVHDSQRNALYVATAEGVYKYIYTTP